MIDRQLRVVAGKDRAATLKELFAKSGIPLGGYELKLRSEQRQPKDIVTACEFRYDGLHAMEDGPSAGPARAIP